jgi:hypothetical protein
VKTSGGVNVTWKVQVCCTFSVAVQLLVWVKVPSAGERENPVMFTAAAPSLVRVALCVMLDPTATLPRLSDAGVKPSTRVAPVPVSEMICLGLPGLLSFSVAVLF